MPRRYSTQSSHTLPNTPTGTAPPTPQTVPSAARPSVAQSLSAAAKRLDKSMQKAAPNTNHRLHMAIDKAVPQVHRALHNGVDALFKSKVPYNPAGYVAPAQHMPVGHVGAPPPPPPPPPPGAAPHYKANEPGQQSPAPEAAARELLGQTNAARASKGLRAVGLSGRLTCVAKAHARDVAAGRRLTHSGSDGSTLGTRLGRGGYAHAHAVENLAKGRGAAADVFASWMRSEEQRRKILDARVREMGAYVAAAADGSLVWVQVLAVRR